MNTLPSPMTRSECRLALRNLRDGIEFNSTLRARVIKAIFRLTDRNLSDDDLPARAAELLQNRHEVKRLVQLLNEHRPRG